MIKPLKNSLMGLLAAAVLLVAGAAYAAPPLEVRMNTAEKVYLPLHVNTSSTINTAVRYATPSPVDGWITGLYFTYEGPNAITSGTAANFVAKVGGVSLTTISITVPSPTAVLDAISSTATVAQVSTTGDVTKGQTIEVDATGSPLMTDTSGGLGRMLIEITPNYTPARLRQ